MADPRDTARHWLADRFHAADCGCQSKVHTEDAWDYYGTLADAILSAPGVEVREEVPGFDVEPGHRVPMYRVVTIRLPVQPIGGSGG